MRINKQSVRNRIGLGASMTEILVAAFILLGILFLTARLVSEIVGILQNLGNSAAMIEPEEFIAHSIDLIIGIEFVKMLVKHTPNSVIEVLLFSISRLVITEHTSMLNVLLGVISIILLFALKHWLSGKAQEESTNDYLMNAGSSVKDVKEQLGIDLDPSLGHTLGGILINHAAGRGESVHVGYRAELNDYVFEVYSMDAKLIKQIKIVKKDA